ncbi:hypothetical protein ACFOS0_24705 [Nocardia seriolae]|uniref:Uncharacterized protein n=3 Tax=Nocardia seriolae TaxID=37332 RepID=A0ABC9Z6N5_9NOCA|nr:hypothetical protein [Nocardia seriolae]MTJ76453.1 hypothetical protein [Nocardia seriolae]GAM51372.1 hypothetical protein NS07_v2contig00243-0001 [Nocardia seriolae]GAP33343.1 hypothetical protein NSK11_contig00247-0007 [Nocardia seriolae]
MPKGRSRSSDERLRTPEAALIARAAADLGLAMNDKCDELARRLLAQTRNDEMPGSGSGQKDTEQSHDELHLELTKLRIRHVANMDLGGAVAAARLVGATWEQVGGACGASKQAAYERWHKVVKEFELARLKAEQRPVDALDQYDPDGLVMGEALYNMAPLEAVLQRLGRVNRDMAQGDAAEGTRPRLD